MTIETSISSQAGKNSRPYFQCVNHRPVPGKRHQRHLHSSKLNFWYWQLAYIPGTGRFSGRLSGFFWFFFSFVPGRGVGSLNKDGRILVWNLIDLFPIPLGKHFSDVPFPTENWGSWISLNIWWDTVSKWTHWLQKEADNLERGLCCACWGCYLGERAILLRKCHPFKDCPGDSTLLNTDNVNFCTRSRPYQCEACRTSGPVSFGKKRFAKYATPAANSVRTTTFHRQN